MAMPVAALGFEAALEFEAAPKRGLPVQPGEGEVGWELGMCALAVLEE